MGYDLKIVGGIIVDGTGAPGYAGDVGVRDGRIVALGDCPDVASRTLDARGAVVTPGFVDLHCHYDGQVSWDADMAPSSLHGVTTCVNGNCGVGFAPVRPGDRDRLLKLMEGVEDIPGAALAEGLTWDWTTFPEYLSAIDARPHTIDLAALVPHDALRVFVMGERALASEGATETDIAAMREVLRDALRAGAAGFSTGRTDNHRASDGSATPASEATTRELAGLAGAFEGFSHGVLQAVSDFDMATGDERFDPEFDVLEAMAAGAHGHFTSVSLMQRDLAPDQWRRILARVDGANAKGIPMRVQVAPKGIGVILGLETTFHPFIGFPSYQRIASLPLAERVAQMRDPGFRARMLAETSQPVAGDGSPIPPMVDLFLSKIELLSLKIFRLGEVPDYEPAIERSLYAESQSRGVGALEALYDAMLDRDGHELLYFPIFNYTEFNLDNVRAMLTHPHALVSLSDGGAHVGTVCDASYASFLLAHWTRDRAEGRIALEEAVRKLTSAGARYLGLTDRGVLAVGKRADVNVIDLSRLKLRAPRLVHDLPAGGRRLLQDADGYLATLVAGEVIRDAQGLTSARPGRVLRLGR
jgi:N-acyl-D-aspartate/D-glutamate deacylase